MWHYRLQSTSTHKINTACLHLTRSQNCTIKRPPPNAFSARHRRLCLNCTKSPLHKHTSHHSISNRQGFTDAAFAPGPCTCPQDIYLCLSCGTSILSADTTYMRAWTWRARYSTFGLGTGIGEGTSGVECGRGRTCLAARYIEKEIDCDADELAELRREMDRLGGSGRSWSGTSYLTQELEGIGGVMKRKVRKSVKVGATVREWEDERETGIYLAREREEGGRSWCGWCERVIVGKQDLDECPGNEETG